MFADSEAAKLSREAKRARELASTDNERLDFGLNMISIQDNARDEKRAAGKTKSRSKTSVQRNRREEKRMDDERVRRTAGQPPARTTASPKKQASSDAVNDTALKDYFAHLDSAVSTPT